MIISVLNITKVRSDPQFIYKNLPRNNMTNKATMRANKIIKIAKETTIMTILFA